MFRRPWFWFWRALARLVARRGARVPMEVR